MLYEALLVLAAACFAMGIVAAKPALTRLGVRGFLRVRLLAGLAGALAIWHGQPLRISLDSAWLVLASLAVCPLGLNLIFFAALRTGRVGPVNSLRFTSPLWVAALSFLLWRAAPSVPEWLSIVLIAAGVGLLVGRGAWTSTATLLGLLSGGFQGGGLLLQQRALEVIGRAELLLYQNALFLLVMLSWSFLSGSERRATGLRPVRGWVLAVVSGLLTYVLGEFLKFVALPEASGYVAIAILQLSLPFSVLFALVLLGERMNRRQLVAIGLVFAGSLAGSLGDAW